MNGTGDAARRFMGEKGSELAGLLRSLPVVLPASGSCAPLDPSSLSFQRTELAGIPNVDIPLDELKLFPEDPPPFELPPPSAPPPAPIPTPPPVFVHQAPRPPSAWPSAQRRPRHVEPLEVEKKAKRAGSRGMIALDVLVLLTLALVLAYRSPLGKHPTVRSKTAHATAFVSYELHRVLAIAKPH